MSRDQKIHRWLVALAAGLAFVGFVVLIQLW